MESREATILELQPLENGKFGPFRKAVVSINDVAETPTIFIDQSKISEPFVGQKIKVFQNEDGWWRLSKDTVVQAKTPDAVINGVLRKELHDVMEEHKILVDTYNYDPLVAAVLINSTK